MPSFINLYIPLFLLLAVVFPHTHTKTGSQSFQWATLMVYPNPLLTIDIFCHRENPIIRSYLWGLESNCKSLGSIVALQDTTKELNSIGLHSCAFNPLPLWLALNLWDLNLQIGLYYLPLVVSVVTGLTQGHQVEGLLDCFHGNHTCSV